MACDEQGRLYVTDSSGDNSRGPEQLKRRSHRIRRLEDTDGDGVFDRSTLFADRMMLPEGSMWLDGSLYVAAPPSIWKLTDTDDDGVADHREEWFEGKTLTGCANDLHGPYRGPDGWIYWCKGAFAEQRYERPGRKPFVTRAAHIFRRRPEGGPVEAVMTGGMDNPVDVAFLPNGERFFTTTFLQHPRDGKRDGIIHAIYGGVYGKFHSVLDDHPRTGGLMPVMTHLGAAAPCGLTTYSSTVFGEDYENNLFATLFNLHKVTRHVLRPSQGSYESVDSDFLVSNHLDFHPTDVIEDADGSLLVCDTGGWYKICCPTSQLAKSDVLGAIYRVSREAAPKIKDPRGQWIEWTTLPPNRILPFLRDSRPVVKERAIDELARRGEQAIPHLTGALHDRNPSHATSAAWTLTRIDHESARAAVRKAIGHPDVTVRRAAIHSVSVWRDRGALSLVTGRLMEPSTCRVAAEALGRIARPGDTGAITALLRASAVAEDRATQHSLTYALIEMGDLEGLRLASRDLVNARALPTALIARRELSDSSIGERDLIRLFGTSDAELFATACAFASRQSSPSAKLVESSLESLLREPSDARIGAFANTSGSVFGRAAFTRLLSNHDSAKHLRLGLDVVARAKIERPDPAWIDALLEGLRHPEIAGDCLERLGSWNLSGDRRASLMKRSIGIFDDPSMPTSLRLTALAALPGGLTPELAKHWPFVLAQLDRSRPIVDRDSAASTVERATLDESMRAALIRALPTISPLEIERAFKVLAASDKKHTETHRALAETLLDAPAAAAISEAEFREWLKSLSPDTQTLAHRVLDRIAPGRLEQKRRLEKIARELPAGDVRRGQLVFHDEKAACIACHALGYLGGRVGPDLTRIGRIRKELDLLEAVLYPSSSFVRSYEPMTVVTKTGRAINGIVRDRSKGHVEIVTGAKSLERIATTDVLEIRPSKTSIMPAGLTEQLTPQQIADLIAFLRASR